MEIKRNRVMEVNDLISRLFNFDFDGDTMAGYSIQSKQSLIFFPKMFVKNLIEFEHMDELLIDYEHESIYSAFMLSKKAKENFDKLIQDEENVKDLKELNDEIINDINANIFFTLNKSFFNGGIPFALYQNKPISFFELLINKILGTIEKDKNEYKLLYTFDTYGILKKKKLNKLTYDFYKWLKEKNQETEFWDRIHLFNKFLLEGSTVFSYSIATFTAKDFLVHNEEIEKFKEKLIQNEPFLAFHQNLLLFEKYILPEVNKNKDGILYNLFESGARLKSVQLLKAVSNTGVPTDIYGKAKPMNIKNALLDGLTPEEYFESGDSARLALAQRQESIPRGGELQRKFFFSTGILRQNKEVYDCFEHTGKERYFEIEIKDKKYLKTLKHRYYKLSKNDEEKIIQGNEEDLIGKTIFLRSPITCQLDNYEICQKCLGEKRPLTENLGAPIGQYLSEAIIQSVLRAHHFGGVFLAKEDKKLIEILDNVDYIRTDQEITILEGSKEDIEYIENFLKEKYEEQQIEIYTFHEKDKSKIEIIVHDLPYSEDAVKILKEITALIDKNNNINEEFIKSTFHKLIDISDENGILNIYFELVMSLLYYDEDNVLYRYSEKEPQKQFALKEIINNIDPKLSIFYNFSKKTIEKIFTNKKVSQSQNVFHMYRDLVSIYK